MGEVGSLGCVGFLVEGTGAVFCWMRLDLFSLVDKTESGGVFWGTCDLIMILSSLSANGWGCVPVLLIVWHRVSSTASCWSLRGAGSSVEMEISGRAFAI